MTTLQARSLRHQERLVSSDNKTSRVVLLPGCLNGISMILLSNFLLKRDVKHVQDVEYGIGCDFNADVAPSRLRFSMSRLPNRGLILEGQTSSSNVDEVSRALDKPQGCCWSTLALLTLDSINIVSG